MPTGLVAELTGHEVRTVGRFCYHGWTAIRFILTMH